VASEGLLRDWPQAGSGIEKHHGYAFQWFGLSALIALLYVWFQIVRRFIPRRSH
jgi:surfeit locus 1 family protein